MPIVIISWFNVASDPLRRAGAISEIYKGTKADAPPTATPKNTLELVSSNMFTEPAENIAPATKINAQINNIFLRPYLSEPKRRPPKAQKNVNYYSVNSFHTRYSFF
jgi:hypothetical protein